MHFCHRQMDRRTDIMAPELIKNHRFHMKTEVSIFHGKWLNFMECVVAMK